MVSEEGLTSFQCMEITGNISTVILIRLIQFIDLILQIKVDKKAIDIILLANWIRWGGDYRYLFDQIGYFFLMSIRRNSLRNLSYFSFSSLESILPDFKSSSEFISL